MKFYTRLLPLLLILGLVGPATAAETARELEWPDLVPEGAGLELILEKYNVYELEDDDPRAGEVFEKIQAYLDAAPVKPELDGQLVKLPGYAIPLEGDGEAAIEFLLVPYFGACIHVPPPPSNQIVYVRSQQEVELETLFEAVWVTGRLKLERVQDELATAGYSLEAVEVAPYREEDLLSR